MLHVLCYTSSSCQCIPGELCAEEAALAYPIQGKSGMVVTGQDLATRAGLEVLKEGGNAVDAAVTAAFVMSVTLPRAGNIGGGGFMLLYSAKTKEVSAFDYWQKAPAKVSRDMFLDKEGNADSRLSRQSALAVSIPGTVSGLAAILKDCGTIPLSRALESAIRYAEEGFVLNEKQSCRHGCIRGASPLLPRRQQRYLSGPTGGSIKPGTVLCRKTWQGL